MGACTFRNTADYAVALAAVQDIRERGWTHTGDPVQTERGNWVLPFVRILTYDLPYKKRAFGSAGVDKNFPNEAAALQWLAENKVVNYNLYRIEKVNGTWRTDW